MYSDDDLPMNGKERNVAFVAIMSAPIFTDVPLHPASVAPNIDATTHDVAVNLKVSLTEPSRDGTG